MFSNTLNGLLAAAVLSLVHLPIAEAQEVLPFPPKPSGSIAGRTIQESIYNPLSEPRRLSADAPNILIVLIDDVGPSMPTSPPTRTVYSTRWAAFPAALRFT